MYIYIYIYVLSYMIVYGRIFWYIIVDVFMAARLPFRWVTGEGGRGWWVKGLRAASEAPKP